MPDLHEFIAFQFKYGIGPAEQRQTMALLTPLVAALSGFKHREYFYGDADQRWFVHLVWESEELLQDSAAEFESNPEAMALLDRMDPASMDYGRYQMLGSMSAAGTG